MSYLKLMAPLHIGSWSYIFKSSKLVASETGSGSEIARRLLALLKLIGTFLEPVFNSALCTYHTLHCTLHYIPSHCTLNCIFHTVSVLGREEGYTVKYTPPSEEVNNQSLQLLYYTVLEDTARYAGLFLAPAEGFGLWLRLFLPFGQK